MSKLLKLGVYVAAGVGTYEILRRYGLLEKAGKWLTEQVPDEYMEQAQQYANQVRDRAQPYVEQAQKAVGQMTGQHGQHQGQSNAPASAQGGVSGTHTDATADTHGQTITGAGRGVSATTDEPNGIHVAHTVGRGVVR